jgi:hypothetical protein
MSDAPEQQRPAGETPSGADPAVDPTVADEADGPGAAGGPPTGEEQAAVNRDLDPPA